MRLALGLGLPYGGEAGVGVPGGSPASKALIDETDGLALSFVDDYFLSSTGHYGSARVKDTSTPANNYNSHPFGLLTYAGASKKWVRGPSGLLIESDPALTLPYEWGVSGNLLGLVRPEPQRTNLITSSEDLSTTWGKNQTTVSTNQVSAPNGEDTADQISETADTGLHSVQFGLTLNVGGTYAFSVFLKAGTRSTVQLAGSAVAFGTGVHANFDLSSGTVGSTGSNATASIEAFKDGWYRCSIVATAISTNAFVHIVSVTSSTAARFESFAGDTDNNFYAWGAQLEEGSSPTSYIQTAGSTVTRAGDVIGPALDAFPWNEGNGVLTVNDEEVEPSDDGTILTLAAPDGHTHIETVKWIPSP